MKKFLALFFCLLFCLSLVSCEKHYTATTVGVSHTVNKITYTTADGSWTKDNVDEMIAHYVDEKATVDMVITITFTAHKPFNYAQAYCVPMLQADDGHGHEPFASTQTFYSESAGDPETEYEEGTHTLTIKAAGVSFFNETSLGGEHVHAVIKELPVKLTFMEFEASYFHSADEGDSHAGHNH